MTTVMQAHELHIAQNGAKSQDVAQKINAIIKESEKKRMWIESLAKDNQEQKDVFREPRLASKSLPKWSR